MKHKNKPEEPLHTHNHVHPAVRSPISHALLVSGRATKSQPDASSSVTNIITAIIMFICT